LARLEIYARNFDKVGPLLEAAIIADRKNEEIGNTPYGNAFIHEILAELHFEQGEYVTALVENTRSRALYLERNKLVAAEAIEVKIGLLQFLTGDPEAAHATATAIWHRLNNTDQNQLWAYNNVTLAMLSLCSGQKEKYMARKESSLAWANQKAGGKELIELIAYLETLECPEMKERTDDQREGKDRKWG
jgi:hypothetical protein